MAAKSDGWKVDVYRCVIKTRCPFARPFRKLRFSRFRSDCSARSLSFAYGTASIGNNGRLHVFSFSVCRFSTPLDTFFFPFHEHPTSLCIVVYHEKTEY